MLDFHFEINHKCVCVRRYNITKMRSEVSIGSLDFKIKNQKSNQSRSV